MSAGHKTLVSMLETAEKRGQSRRGNWCVTYWSDEIADGNISYEYFRVYHWNTQVLEIQGTKLGTSDYKYRINAIYGESVSDARGINATLEYFGIGARFTYKPVNGGFQRVEPPQPKHKTLDDYMHTRYTN